MIINDLDGYYIVFDTKNWNTELDTLSINIDSKTFANSDIIPNFASKFPLDKQTNKLVIGIILITYL